MDELRKKGLEKMNEVYGWEMPNVEGDPFFDLTVDHLFGTIWNRPGLSKRERCLATFAVLVIGGTLGAPFKAHIARCVAERLPEADLRAAIRILAEFSIPKAWEALIALKRVLAH